MNYSKVLRWSIFVALGGFLFGLDTVVISGAEQTIQQLWGLSPQAHGWVIAAAVWGTVVGALLGGLPSDRLGRKMTLFWIGALFMVSAIGTALSQDVTTFVLFRFLGGLAIGSSSVTAPLYIAEVAPADVRGRFVALFQFNIVFGILIAFVANYFLYGSAGADTWRWMLGWVALPSALFSVAVLTVPESPRWLALKKGDSAAALAVLRQINPHTAESELVEIKKSQSAAGSTGSLRSFLSSKYAFLILLAFLIAFFNQLSGINAVLYYAKRILEEAGMDERGALLFSVVIGVANLVFTLLGMSIIDRFGRRFLMYIGSFGYIVSLGGMAWVFMTGVSGNVALVSVLAILFIASHAIGQGAVIWVFISEIFPNSVRSWGNSLGSATHWVFAAIITTVFPAVQAQFGAGKIFAFFAIMMVLQLLYVWRLMPETKGVSLEDLEKELAGG